MKRKTFEGELLSGHKQDALEVPFDPVQEWNVPPQPLWHGRRGFRVKAQVKGVAFDSTIVPRQKKFYLLIDPEVVKPTGIVVGSRIRVIVEPS